jgi:hypothetical protein
MHFDYSKYYMGGIFWKKMAVVARRIPTPAVLMRSVIDGKMFLQRLLSVFALFDGGISLFGLEVSTLCLLNERPRRFCCSFLEGLIFVSLLSSGEFLDLFEKK